MSCWLSEKSSAQVRNPPRLQADKSQPFTLESRLPEISHGTPNVRVQPPVKNMTEATAHEQMARRSDRDVLGFTAYSSPEIVLSLVSVRETSR